jgi:hypothetical protein
MKKNVLALSIAAMVGGLGFAGAASAQSFQVNESGTGHILVVPYYTAQNGNMSVFHLTNTDTIRGKAVKVRFRGASNSDDVLDFQVFMSPGDVWTAAVTADAAGKAQLVTADNTCTLPAIAKNTPVPFVTDRLARQGWTDADKAAQTREGYVEILNMADISNQSASLKDASLFKATKHVNGVAPCTSAVLQDTLLGYPAMASQSELSAPTATLTGSWYVINVSQSTTFSGATPALVGNAPTRVVFSPQVEGETTIKTSDPLMVAGTIKAQHYDVPDLSTPYFASQSLTSQTDADTNATNLTNALGRNTIMNQYATDAGIFAKTDWVFSMPTRRYTVAANYASTSATYAGQLNVSATGTPSATDLNAYTYINSAVTGNIFSTGAKVSANDQGQLCVTASKQEFYDREENVQTSGAIFSPGTTKTAKLCGEVSVLSFTSDASALGAAVARQTVAAPYTNGWGTIGFGTDRAPVLGAAFLKLTNPQAVPGTVGTYGITWPHAYGTAAQ